MPLVKIELAKGLAKDTLLELKKSVMNSVVEVLQLPDNDRNIRLMEYEPEFFSMKNPYEILIEITIFSGRTKETKKKLFQTIVQKLSTIHIEKENVFIVLNEQPLENWGVRGGIPADEIKLDVDVKI
ncbi:MAG: tautomerase family protein [Paludibacteraceae bacterium]